MVHTTGEKILESFPGKDILAQRVYFFIEELHMSSKVKGILQKINFIQTDMDLHRDILFSIPSDQKEEMEKVMVAMAEMKAQIEDLRQKIKEIDEDEYNRIIAIEAATQKFRTLSEGRKFAQVNTLNETGECFITLTEGTRIDCLVAAQEDNGNWIVLTLDGETREYPGGVVQ